MIDVAIDLQLTALEYSATQMMLCPYGQRYMHDNPSHSGHPGRVGSVCHHVAKELFEAIRSTGDLPNKVGNFVDEEVNKAGELYKLDGMGILEASAIMRKFANTSIMRDFDVDNLYKMERGIAIDNKGAFIPWDESMEHFNKKPGQKSCPELMLKAIPDQCYVLRDDNGQLFLRVLDFKTDRGIPSQIVLDDKTIIHRTRWQLSIYAWLLLAYILKDLPIDYVTGRLHYMRFNTHRDIFLSVEEVKKNAELAISRIKHVEGLQRFNKVVGKSCLYCPLLLEECSKSIEEELDKDDIITDHRTASTELKKMLLTEPILAKRKARLTNYVKATGEDANYKGVTFGIQEKSTEYKDVSKIFHIISEELPDADAMHFLNFAWTKGNSLPESVKERITAEACSDIPGTIISLSGSKADLLEVARKLGLDVNDKMTKDQLKILIAKSK